MANELIPKVYITDAPSWVQILQDHITCWSAVLGDIGEIWRWVRR